MTNQTLEQRHKRIPFFSGLLSAGMVILMVFIPAHAQEWVYTVHPDDTLWDIADKYLIDGTRRTERLRRLNNIDDPMKLPPGIRIKIPVRWMKQQPAPVVVLKLQGQCRAISADKGPYDLSPGMKLQIGETIRTEANANLTLQFADGSKLLMQEQSELVLDKVSTYGDTGMVDTRLHLRSGYVDTHVQPKKGPGSRYEISTPSAVAAVRGTDFRVNADIRSDSMRSEVIEGKIGLAAEGTARQIDEGFGVIQKRGEKPSAPIKLLAPIETSGLPTVLHYLPLQIDWPALPKALRYRVQVAPDSLFEELLADTIVDKPKAVLPELMDGRYALRVRGIDENELEGFNATHEFEVDARPEPPLPLNPKNKASVYDPQPKFWWSKPEGSVSYHLQLSRGSDFSTLLLDLPNFTESQFVVEQPLSFDRFFWRLSSYDETGDEGPFGPAQTFTVKAKPAAPEPGETGIGEAEIHFQWKTDPDAARYHFQFSEDDDFEELIIDEEVTENEYTLPSADLSGSYYFRIRTINSDDVPGSFCTVQEIEVPGKTSPYWALLLLLGLIPLLL
ncbi:MAG: FecR domain-containing protein [Gammaproteobacteria bacterium]